MTCRFCDSILEHTMCDLRSSPLANAYLGADDLDRGETYYPLRVLVCSRCYLAQLAEYAAPSEIFADYAYFSSYSTSWLEHCRAYAQQMIRQLELGPQTLVVELASNDGYLLQYFQQAGAEVLGIEPAQNVASEAQRHGIPTIAKFFGSALANELLGSHRQPDLLVANNVLAHVPDINDFVEGISLLLPDTGLATFEFPHLLRLLEERQFDTIYHEHFSYLSLTTTATIFAAHGLRVVDVEEIPTHGGSLRIHAAKEGTARQAAPRVTELLEREHAAGLMDLATYERFAEVVRDEKRRTLRFLFDRLDEGVRIAGYGAPAKGNTLLNYCGVGTDIVPFTVDLSPHKQGLYLPGSRIPILAPDALDEHHPDLVLILPWNLREEILDQLWRVREWGGQFAARTPDLRILP